MDLKPKTPRELKGRSARGGKRHRPDWTRSVNAVVRSLQDTGSTSDRLASSSNCAMNSHFDGEETPEDHIIPRRSTTRQQYLGIVPQTLEFEELKPVWRLQRIMKGKDKGKLVETTEPNIRVTWKSDKTLLNRSKVESFETLAKQFSRVTSHSKRRVYQPEQLDIDDSRPANDDTKKL